MTELIFLRTVIVVMYVVGVVTLWAFIDKEEIEDLKVKLLLWPVFGTVVMVSAAIETAIHAIRRR